MKLAPLLIALVLPTACHRSAPGETVDPPVQSATTKAPSEGCKACQARHCSAVLAACTSKECIDVRACLRDTKCGDAKRETLVPCYCGSVEQDECFFAKAVPNGPCKAVIESGAKSSSALEVGQRYFDMAYPAGQAIQLATCEQAFCQECL